MLKIIDRHSLKIEIFVLSLFTFLINFNLFLGENPNSNFIFYPDKVVSGQWWRLITSPFVHSSLYHLTLDFSAFIILYIIIGEIQFKQRFAVFLGAIAGSILIGSAFSIAVSSIGLCGLSGVAHGLMAVAALIIISKNKKIIGVIILFVIITKVIFECTTGNVFFLSMHHGACGIPIAGSHGGGVIGALFIYALLKISSKKKCLRSINGTAINQN